MSKEALEAGLAVQREVFGAGMAERAMAGQTDYTKPFQELLTSFCFGEVWTRPGLGRRDRSMLTLAMLIALNRPAEIKVHVRGAIANGVTKDEIMEILIHAMAYCGVPYAVDARRAAVEELQAMGLEPGPAS